LSSFNLFKFHNLKINENEDVKDSSLRGIEKII